MNDGDDLNSPKDEKANAEREGWNADHLGNEASQTDKDEIQRRMKRGDESKGNADNRDDAGHISSKDTPQGREEAKNDTEGKANDNG